MSKAVKGVARGIGKVVKGVGNVVKKVVKSKLGKIIVGAALVYFGGAALMGGFSSAAAGGSFLSGASAGLSSAASGISGAWSALTGGQGLSAAGSSLSSGFTGASAAGSASATGTLGFAPLDVGGTELMSAASSAPAGGSLAGLEAPMSDMLGASAAPGSSVSSSVGGYPGAAPADALSGYDQAMVDLANSTSPVNTAAAKPGLIGRAADWFSSLKPSQQVMVAQMGGGLLSTGLKAYGAYQTGQEQQQLQEDARRRYNANIGGYRYGG